MAFKRPARSDDFTTSEQEAAEREEFLRAILGEPPRSSPVENEFEQTRSLELREFLHDILTPDEFFVREGAWDPSKHPRRGTDPNAGWFADKGTGTTSARGAAPNNDSTAYPVPEEQPASPFRLASKKAAGSKLRAGSKSGTSKRSAGGATSTPLPHEQTDPANWFLPSDDRGTWTGGKGDSTFRLKEPIETSGRSIREVHFRNGVPVLDGFALPGEAATIVLTGDHRTDIDNARRAWSNLNPGMDLSGDATFHHDLLHVSEEIVEIDGKKVKVLVGKMHLIPKRLNQMIFHEGSASVARKYYQALGIDIKLVSRFAKEQAMVAAKASKFISKAVKNIKPGVIPKGIGKFVGRKVVRIIPFIGTGMAVIEFADNVEAHGLGGAALRTTPLLGELISAHDLGSELAKQIADDANKSADDTYRKNQGIIDEAWQKASMETIQAYEELAQKITVTNAGSHLPRLVDPHEVADALDSHRNKMQAAIHLELERGGNMISSLARKSAKEELRKRLTKAAQKHAPRKRLGPII